MHFPKQISKSKLFTFILFFLFFIFQFIYVFANENSSREIPFFYTASCEDCQEVVPKIKEYFKDKLILKEYDLDNLDNFEIMLHLEEQYGIDESSNIALFFPSKVIQGKDDILARIEKAYQEYQLNINHSMKENLAIPPSNNSIYSRFEKLSIGVIVVAGLVDGLNPCVFSTIIFLVTFLITTKRDKKSIYQIGFGFIAATFVTYLLLGIGLLKIFKSLESLKIVVDVLIFLFACFSAVIAMMHLRDLLSYLINRNTGSIKVKLPNNLKKWVVRLIHEKLSNKHLILSAIFLGILVTLVESICSGQLYLPIIYLMIQKQETLHLTPYLYLIGYNVFFILPLIFVFFLVAKGAQSRFLLDISKKNLILSKTLLILLFSTLAFLLFLS